MAAQGGRDREKLVEQVRRLRENCAQRPEDPFELGVRWLEEDVEIDFLYRKDQMLCDASDLAEVKEAFAAIEETWVGDDEVVEGPVNLRIIPTGDRDAADLAEKLSQHLGDDQIVSPTYVLDTQARSNMCPATDPLPWSGSVSVWPEPVGTRDVAVAVVDTGWAEQARTDSGFERFRAVEGRSEPDDEVYFADGSTIRPYGAHGAATTACLLAVAGADRVKVEVRDVLVGGGVDELSILHDLVAVVEAGVDVISLQAGFYTSGNREPKSFVNLRRHLLVRHRRTVIIAAAGNDGWDRPFWPAALGYITAVGALTKGGDSRARWSNLGHWVDVYATGEYVLVPYVNGRFVYTDGTSAEFTAGHAVWSGTSFAAPYVAGLVARRMVERDVDSRTALRQVMDEARDAALPATGPRVVV